MYLFFLRFVLYGWYAEIKLFGPIVPLIRCLGGARMHLLLSVLGLDILSANQICIEFSLVVLTGLV
jgi:hypothetical protein